MKSLQEGLRLAYERRNTRALAKALLGVELTPKQGQIARAVCFGEDKRTCITAFTRYGKTYSVAVGACLGIILNQGKPLRWAIIAPTYKQAGILRSYIADLIVASPILADHLELEQVQDVTRLKREVSKSRMTFKDGQELAIHSAEGKAEALMGFGADRIFVDEAALVSDAVFTSRILRMLGDSPNACLTLITNPWHSAGFFGRAWDDPAYVRLQIGYDVGLEEGRITQEQVDEARKHLAPSEFQVLYEARFPDATEDQLIPWSWLTRATVPEASVAGSVVYGLDVAEGGGDMCVLSDLAVNSGRYALLQQASWREADTQATVNRVSSLVPSGASITVDATGVGKGVADSLNAGGYHVRQLKVGRAAKDATRFTNLKAETWWNLRLAFEEERIELVNPSPDLLKDLARMRYDTETGRVRVKEEGGKSSGSSTDYGDSLAYSLPVATSGVKPKAVPRRNTLF